MWLTGIVLGVLLGASLLYNNLLIRELRRMEEELQEISGQISNQQLRVEWPAPPLVALANTINTYIQTTQRERRQHLRAMTDTKASMANISHDLRTPLTSILGYIRLAQKEEMDTEARQNYLAIAYEKSVFLHQLVDQLFELARLDAGAVPLQMERLDAGALLAEELASQYSAFGQLGFSLQVELEENNLPVIADAQGVTRVYANLLQNMLRYADGDLRVSAWRQGDQAVLEFCNQTHRLTPEQAEKMFERFYTGDQSRTQRSAGIGLAIARELVTQMGGTITAQMQQEQLCIRVCWPLAK